MSRAVTETHSEPPKSPGAPPSRGRIGLWTIGIGLALIVVWLGIRVATSVGEQQALANERSAPVDPNKKLPVVQIVKPARAEWTPSVPFEGTIEAEQRSILAFKVGGRLTHVEVRLGDVVRAGQILGRLDPSEASAQQSSAAAQFQAAEAQVILAEDAERRTSQLVASGSLAEANGIQAEQQRALAQAQARAAKAQLGLASVSLGNHTLTAPFAGVVTRAPTTRGAVVGPGEPLFEVVDLTKLRLKGSINERDASVVQVGSKVTIQTDGGLATGKVRAIVSVLDAVTRRVPVEADLEAHSALRVGAFARARIEDDEKIQVWSLPGHTLRPGSQDVVLVVNDGVLEERALLFTVDPKSGDLLVRQGLTGNEQIVLAPLPEARSGDRVRLKEEASAAQQAPTAAQNQEATP